MGFFLMLAVGLVVVVVFLLVIGAMYPGNGADLLDYDPVGRAAKKILAEDEDAIQMQDLQAERERQAQRRAQRHGDPG
jgi:hypothetical protein